MEVGASNYLNNVLSYATKANSPQTRATIREDPVDMNPKMSQEDRANLSKIAALQGKSAIEITAGFALHRDASMHGTPMLGGHPIESVDDYILALILNAEASGGKGFFGVSSARYGSLIDDTA